jgi:hypothetical protein
MKRTDYCWWHSFGHLSHAPFYKNTTFMITIVGLIIGIASLIIGGYKLFRYLKDVEKASLAGRLRSQEAPLSKELIQVYFGTNCYAYPVEMLGNEKIIHPFSGVDIRLKDDKILVSAKVRNIDGKTYADLTDNEWEIIKNNRFKRNYDSTALEVCDADSGLVVLQVELLDRQSLRLSGLFEDGTFLLCVTDSPEILRVPRSEIEKYADRIESCLKTQERLFEYPSDLHLHERTTNTKATRFKDSLLKQKEELERRRGEYTRITNEDLRKKALALAEELTKLCQSEPTLPDSFPLATGPNSYMDQIRKELEPSIKYDKSVVAKFNENFRVEAIILRDELLSRQPQQTRKYDIYNNYEGAVNLVVISLIAEDLRRLANSL